MRSSTPSTASQETLSPIILAYVALTAWGFGLGAAAGLALGYLLWR